MKKKVLCIVATLVLAILCVSLLAACNNYKWKSIGGGDPSAKVESNGGYVVKQGKYLYYINGYDSEAADNTWGKPVKQAIVRSELKADGSVDNSTTKVVVPKVVQYNTSDKDGGFAIFNDWIYYATDNSDKDKNGVASTTDTDFMRTKIDGSVTQLIGRINVRTARILYTPTRILYYNNNAINYFDFSGMKNDRPVASGSGAKQGTLVDNVASCVWQMGHDFIYYVRTLTGANAYKSYNELCSIKVDGSEQKVIATEDTFLGQNEKPEEHVLSVYQYTISDMYIESDGGVTLYYTLSHATGESTASDGLFCSKAADFKNTRKKLTSRSASTIYPLGYEQGAIVDVSSNGLYWFDGAVDADGFVGEDISSRLVVESSNTVWYIDSKNMEVYYSSSSSASSLCKVSYDVKEENRGNATSVFEESMKVDWLNLDFVVIGDKLNLFFFATNDENYMHVINILAPAVDEDGNPKSDYVGFEREEDEEEAE